MNIMSRTTFFPALAFAALFAIAWLPSTAHAQDSAQVEVTIVIASSSGDAMDSSLSTHASRLRSQFSQYSSFSMHGRDAFRLNVGETRNISLPGGRQASISLQGARSGGNDFAISVPGGSTVMRSPAGGVFIIAGPSVSGGTIILIFRT